MTDKLNNLYGKVKQDWSKQEILDGIDDIIADFESRICDKCKYFMEGEDISHACSAGNSCGIDEYGVPSVLRSFGCIEFKRKQDG